MPESEVETEPKQEDSGDLLYRQEIERANREYRENIERQIRSLEEKLSSGLTPDAMEVLAVEMFPSAKRLPKEKEPNIEEKMRKRAEEAAKGGFPTTCIVALENTSLSIPEKKKLLAEAYEKQGSESETEALRIAGWAAPEDVEYLRERGRVARERVRILRGEK